MFDSLIDTLFGDGRDTLYCEHTMVEFEDTLVERGDFDHESGTFEWISKRTIGKRCLVCGKENVEEAETKRFLYRADKVEFIDDDG